MKCPFCNNDEDKVIDSRPAREGQAIRRRRECAVCGARFTTYEAPEHVTVLVIKKDGTREPFVRQKVLSGISTACIKRPVTVQQMEHIALAVESKVLGIDGREVTSQQIGQWTMDELLVLDEVAYVRFASVFNRYGSLDEFLTELDSIRNTVRDSSQTG